MWKGFREVWIRQTVSHMGQCRTMQDFLGGFSSATRSICCLLTVHLAGSLAGPANTQLHGHRVASTLLPACIGSGMLQGVGAAPITQTTSDCTSFESHSPGTLHTHEDCSSPVHCPNHIDFP